MHSRNAMPHSCCLHKGAVSSEYKHVLKLPSHHDEIIACMSALTIILGFN